MVAYPSRASWERLGVIVQFREDWPGLLGKRALGCTAGVFDFNFGLAAADRADVTVLRPRPVDLWSRVLSTARLLVVGELSLQSKTGGPGEADGPLIRLFESYRVDLIRFSLWLVRDPTVAEDVVQETLLRAWRSRGALREQTAVRPWLFTIARREYARLYERKRLPLVDIYECELQEDEALARYDEDPQIEDLRRAILMLPDEYRIPLVMQVLGGLSTAEIAAELNLSGAAVLTRLYRARNRLREIYGTAAPDGEETPEERV